MYLEREHRTRLFDTDGELAFGAEGVGENSLNAKPPSAIDELPTSFRDSRPSTRSSNQVTLLRWPNAASRKDLLAKWLGVSADGD